VEESLEKNLSGLPPEKISRTYSYLDGIGRTMQTLELNSTPAKNDYVSFHLYDPFGREQIRPLRYGINAKGEFRSSPALEHSNFYAATPNVVSDPEAFAEVQFDDSPLNQVKKSLGIGWKWHNDVDNKASTSNVRLNETNEVLLLLLDASGLPVYSPTSFYPANALLITEEIDEAGRVKRSYKDLRDNLVLERVGDGSSWQDLYYMNDAGGKVLFVFPPEGSSRFSEYASSDRNLFLNTWCYQYKYDQYNRLSEKKGPGGSWEFYVYDRWDRVVAKQDGNQRTSSSWTYTKFQE
jgi:hypothetical protein